MGFSPKSLDAKKILDAVTKRRIKGIAILCGSNNVKYTQDQELVTLAQELLKNDILCLSKGEASVALAKYGFLNPDSKIKEVGKGLSNLLSSFGKETPSIIASAGNIPVDVQALNVDLMTFAAHQFYGPKGAAALYVKEGTRIVPLI